MKCLKDKEWDSTGDMMKYSPDAIQFVLWVLLAAGGCSSTGRYYAESDSVMVNIQTRQFNQDLGKILKNAQGMDCTFNNSEAVSNRLNTLFIHPGLMLSDFDADSSLARYAGLLLVREGFAGSLSVLSGRNTGMIYQRMLTDPGVRFIGIHYSMGGKPEIVKNSILAARRAALESGKLKQYSPILVDPAGMGSLGELVDMDTPQLGQVFIIVSSENSMFRSDIMHTSLDFLNHPKNHFIYPEDFGLTWDHYGALINFEKTTDLSNSQAKRTKELFHFIVGAIINGMNGNQIKSGLAFLKLKYAQEDKRPIIKAWLDQVRETACSSKMAVRQDIIHN